VADLAAVLSVPVAPAVDEPARRSVAPGEQFVSLTAGVPGHMRWGRIPVGRKTKRGRPVMETLTNARSGSLYDKSVHA
jgi:hypothetical protein